MNKQYDLTQFIIWPRSSWYCQSVCPVVNGTSFRGSTLRLWSSQYSSSTSLVLADLILELRGGIFGDRHQSLQLLLLPLIRIYSRQSKLVLFIRNFLQCYWRQLRYYRDRFRHDRIRLRKQVSNSCLAISKDPNVTDIRWSAATLLRLLWRWIFSMRTWASWRSTTRRSRWRLMRLRIGRIDWIVSFLLGRA